LTALFGLMGLVGLMGGNSLLTSVPIANWFVRQRGLAMSIGMLGTILGAVISVLLTQVFIDGMGWRPAAPMTFAATTSWA
jgi:hypothetical protein